MTIATVGTLFPAIPLAIVALNFRYTSLVGVDAEHFVANRNPSISLGRIF